MNILNKLSITTAGTILVGLGTINAVQAAQTYYGSVQPMEQGTARSFVTLDEQGHPSSIGAVFDQAAFNSLPPKINTLYTMYELPLPSEAASTAYTDIQIDWAAQGTEPRQLLGVPFLDVHFFTVGPEARKQITLSTPEDVQKMYKQPLPEFIPKGYIQPRDPQGQPIAGVPGMGSHWYDPNAPELQNLPLSTKALFNVSYNGNWTAIETAIAKKYLDTKPSFTEALALPDAYMKNAYYPTSYSLKYDEINQDYIVSMDGLTLRSATTITVPEPSSPLVNTLVISALLGTSLALKQKDKKQKCRV